MQAALELVEKGENFARYGQKEKAIARYKKAIEAEPGLWKAYFKLSSAYKDTRMRREELDTLQSALTICQTDKERAMTLNNLTDVLSFFGEYEDAIMCLEQAITLEPESSIYWGNLCGMLIRGREYQRSLMPLKQLKELVGDETLTYLYNSGMAYFGLGHYAKAAINFEKCVELQPERKYLWRYLAKVYVELERYTDAEYICHERMRSGLASYLILANIRCRTGHKVEAAAMTQKALEAMGKPSRFDEVRWHYCNRMSHYELMESVQSIAQKLDDAPWPHWILARLAAVLDDTDMIKEQLHEILNIDETFRPNLEIDDYFQNLDIMQLLDSR